ncbi:MAG: DNA repair protein RecO [Lachnospiraceae bacterium]|nr:DNA repair protein RecO [Lachnospiraceae bacterium]
MQGIIDVTGMILKQSPMGEYDRRVCVLTKERGKISAFAKGARKPGSRLAAATNLFAFGTFKLYVGRNSYTMTDAEISNYFENLMVDYQGAYYGMYFTEIADYYTRENNDEREMLKLLYQSMRALGAESLSNPLVRCIFELKAIVINGEFPGLPSDRKLLESTIYALEYIAASPVEKLYTFTVKEEVLDELRQIAREYMNRIVGHTFKSLEILETLC